MRHKPLLALALCLTLAAGCSSSSSSDASLADTLAKTQTTTDISSNTESDSSAESESTTVDFKNLEFSIPSSWSDTLVESDSDTWYWYPDGGILMAMDVGEYLNLEMDYDEEYGENFMKDWGDQFASCTAGKPATEKVDGFPAFSFTATVTNKEGTEYNAKVIVFDGKETSYAMSFLNAADSQTDNLPEFDTIIQSIIVK